jgi:ATP-dependent Clp protease protease subunit
MPKILDFKNKFQSPLTIRAKGAKKAEIILYGSIGQSWFDDGITAKKFSDELKSLDASVEELDVRINSPGGDVFDGFAIYNRLKQHKAKKTIYIDALAASAASVIALAGDEVIMGEGALYMIHLPWTFSMGNRVDLDNTVARLLDIEEQMISLYQKRTKLDRSEIKAMLEAETWMDADDAIDQGFVDSKIDEALPIAASVFDKASWIKRPPKNFVNESSFVKEKIANLKAKVDAKIAR